LRTLAPLPREDLKGHRVQIQGLRSYSCFQITRNPAISTYYSYSSTWRRRTGCFCQYELRNASACSGSQLPSGLKSLHSLISSGRPALRLAATAGPRRPRARAARGEHAARPRIWARSAPGREARRAGEKHSHADAMRTTRTVRAPRPAGRHRR
jgi:hypothetical protein